MAKSKNKKQFTKHGAQQASLKSKKRKMQHFERVSTSSSTNPNKKTKLNNQTNPSTANSSSNNVSSKKKGHKQDLHQRPIIPYRRTDRILLIGEGDFSFARSLVKHHRCRKVFASCYDSRDVLVEKYAGRHVEENIEAFLRAGMSKSAAEAADDTSNQKRKVLFSVDARKLGSPAGGGKEIRRGIKQDNQTGGPWDIISFNFPHIGGKSTDVNRQVRANQELLVAFFKACVPLLSTSAPKENDGDDYDNDDDEERKFGVNADSDGDSSRYHTDSEDEDEEEEEKEQIRTVPRQSGQIIVTLFEGEPYTLWNIKDLARHAGLSVVTSFRFPWKSYPGYSHARTLGVVESRSGKIGAGWKGEDRDARSYVFEVKQADGQRRPITKKEESSDEDD